jgi:mannitol/fructose-specific phosphotransferase system IIA component (Ntr-type)
LTTEHNIGMDGHQLLKDFDMNCLKAIGMSVMDKLLEKDYLFNKLGETPLDEDDDETLRGQFASLLLIDDRDKVEHYLETIQKIAAILLDPKNEQTIRNYAKSSIKILFAQDAQVNTL